MSSSRSLSKARLDEFQTLKRKTAGCSCGDRRASNLPVFRFGNDSFPSLYRIRELRGFQVIIANPVTRPVRTLFRSALDCLPFPRIGAAAPMTLPGQRNLTAFKAGARPLSFEKTAAWPQASSITSQSRSTAIAASACFSSETQTDSFSSKCTGFWHARYSLRRLLHLPLMIANSRPRALLQA